MEMTCMEDKKKLYLHSNTHRNLRKRYIGTRSLYKLKNTFNMKIQH